MPDIGKHFIVGVQGEELTSKERTLWKELRPLGVIIFKRNISTCDTWREKLVKLVAELRDLSGREDFVSSIDHEGGRVHRLTSPITRFPAAKNWKEDSFKVGQAMGRELSSLEINLNFAPSFDILTEPKNTVIGDRALDTNPESVSLRGLSFLDGLESAGVLGCAKHFPGHGGTVEDSHKDLPVISLSKEELENREIVPFIKYIESGRQLIMTAHVVYKALDPNSPATLSKPILSTLLREKLGYQGAIITDALDMGALSGIAEGEVAKKFLLAGGDLFCVCQDTNDRNKEGIKISPVESALLYANAIKNDRALTPELKRSSECIERFLTKLKNVKNVQRAVLSESDFVQHGKLLQEIVSKNV